MRDTIGFVFSVEEILDGLDRRIDGARHDLQAFRREHSSVLVARDRSPRSVKVRRYAQAGVDERMRLLTELRRWKACLGRLKSTAQFRLDIADCRFFDIPASEPDYATGGPVTNTGPFLVGEGTHIRTLETNQSGSR